MRYSRGEALILKEEIITKLNNMAEQRTKLKLDLQEVSQIADETPKDAIGHDLETNEIDGKFEKLHKRAKADLK